MAEKRKISIRKILQLFVTMVVTTCCVIAMVSASRIEDKKTLKGIAVHIRNDKKYQFVEQKEIVDLAITKRNIDITHTPLAALDVHGMEKVIRANPWISDAQVYIDNDLILHMYVTQRIPVARVFQKNTASYYVDTTLSIMPLSDKFIYYATVVTNVPEIKNDSTGWALRSRIVGMVRHIQSDSFWSAQISQIIVDSNAQFELMPTLGNQRILFGDATDMKRKFGNLFVFYKEVLNRIGWDKYETLDLRYKDQVIALPSLPYKGPVDKAVDKMNWITSIVETEDVIDAKDSVRQAEAKAAREAQEKIRAMETHKPVLVLKSKPNKKPGAKPEVKKEKYTYVKKGEEGKAKDSKDHRPAGAKATATNSKTAVVAKDNKKPSEKDALAKKKVTPPQKGNEKPAKGAKTVTVQKKETKKEKTTTTKETKVATAGKNETGKEKSKGTVVAAGKEPVKHKEIKKDEKTGNGKKEKIVKKTEAKTTEKTKEKKGNKTKEATPKYVYPEKKVQ